MGRTKRDGSSSAVESSDAVGISAEKADEFAQLFLHALNNKDIAVKLREAMGVSKMLAGLEQEVRMLRTELAKKDARIDSLAEQVEELKTGQDDLEQYSRRNSVRLSGIVEKRDEDVVESVLSTFNTLMNIWPPIHVSEIDRIHRIGKPDDHRRRPILVKFATYRSKRRVLENRRQLNPLKRTERRATLGDFIGPQTEAEAASEESRRVGERLYLNDDLSRYCSRLLFECRQAKKKTLISDCRSYDGNIVIKSLTNTISTIKTSSDLERVCMRTIN